MNKYTEEEEQVVFTEPILAQKAVRLKVGFAEKSEWKLKQDVTVNGILHEKDKAFDACKLTLHIDDASVQTEHPDGKAKLVIDDQFNIESYPIIDKKTGAGRMMGRSALYQLETVFGFDPVFQVNGQRVDAFVTKNGNKVAPKIEGVKRVINPEFFNAYFGNDGIPNMSNWADKIVYADIEVERSEQFGDKNVVKRYVKAPAV